MTSSALAQSAYARTTTIAPSARETEYRAFARITSDLTNLLESGATDFPKLAAAMHDNQRLWGLIAADVASDDNQLPRPLRAQLFYLAEFTQIHSRKVLAGEADVAPLIDVNRSVMRGLRAQGGA